MPHYRNGKSTSPLNMKRPASSDTIHTNSRIQENFIPTSTPIMSTPLAYLFNNSSDTGFIHDDWRRAQMPPIFKASSKTLANNYRQISLKNFICKFLIRDSIATNLHRNRLLHDAQHGVRTGRSYHPNLRMTLITPPSSLAEVNLCFSDLSLRCG